MMVLGANPDRQFSFLNLVYSLIFLIVREATVKTYFFLGESDLSISAFIGAILQFIFYDFIK